MPYRFRWMMAAALVSITACQPSQPQGGAALQIPAVVATVDGESISAKELQDAAAGQLTRLNAEIYQIHKVALDNLVGEKLIAAKAKKEGKTPEEFLKQEIDAKIEAPTEEALKQFYEQNKGQMGGKSFAEIRDQIEKFLVSSQQRQLEQQMASSLQAGAEIKTFIEPPRVKVAAGDAPGRGPKDAPVTVIEFSDYQCPFCGRSRPTVTQILEHYGDKVRYVFRDFPLSFHAQAMKAHEAAYCAGDQGKYWEMNTKLFESQRALEVDQLKKYAEELSLTMPDFTQCLESGKYVERIKKNVDEGSAVGVTGTPAFFINGIPVSGARPFADFQKIIDEELQRDS
ncbi:MAG: thioredoxin domain-containing protein [Deltaproteobacteria bacterium]|nr:thioredoxin domain-containing protein [Deltaproteobacteria bacterium]